ncbi:hypothetical protein DSL64_00795 [Dyadobacter luteus]|jgi:hypothetical protein|uniref:Uncharacterized protein n=1 Tax=Dyadobacter luteus TaxID=2259619 RepID=A0A3D8YHG9_9BACT|nr:hypothetical protein [Dyadobacter luteus]REA64125.1 hypothetical protein DSL64_00795 [Dyadobacter luteus]
MIKSKFVSAIVLAVFGTIAVNAQSIVDPGVSVYNYKHPNKAAKAKAVQGEKTIRVANMNTVEGYYKRQNRGTNVSTTPKYAPRPASLVVTRTYQKEGVDINPLVSPRNYKTPAGNTVSKPNTEVADYYNPKDSTTLPTVD